MKIQKKYIIIFLFSLLFILSIILGLKSWKYIIYTPFFWEKLVAKPSNAPLEAFNNFQTALENKGNTYLKYITKETRDKYKKLLSNPRVRERYLQPLVNVQEQYIIDCDNKLTCEHIAVYSYDYTISEPYWEKISGKRFLIPAGTQELEMRFVEIKKGYWQLNEF